MKRWIRVANTEDVPTGGGGCVKLGGVQIALFKVPLMQNGAGHTDAHEWYAVQNLCPHDSRQVLSRGLTGDAKGEPKVACPLHKNGFSLASGEHLAGPSSKAEWRLETFPIKEEGGFVFVAFDTSRLIPPPEAVHDSDPTYGHGSAN